MRIVSILAFVVLVLFVFGRPMNISAGRVDSNAPLIAATAGNITPPSVRAAEPVHESAATFHLHEPTVAARWLTQFEPLLLLLLGSVLLSISTGIRLLLGRK